MSGKTIELTVNFTARIRSQDEHVPTSEVYGQESITITMPILDTRYTVFPKVLEGVTNRVIAELNARYSEWLHVQQQEAERQAEEKEFLWNQADSE